MSALWKSISGCASVRADEFRGKELRHPREFGDVVEND
jgi:hypothetical protein